VISVTWCAIAGSVISWDAEKTSGSWSVGENWVGGVAPGGEDAALFTVGASAALSVGIDQAVCVSNIWVYGGGKVTLKAAGATQVMVTGNTKDGVEVSKVKTAGSGRQSVYVTGGSTLVVDGIAVTNNQTTTYHDLQMNQASTLIITNGAEFAMPVRLPANGAGAQNSDTFTVIVTGKGSKFAKTGGGMGTQISSNGGRIYCENGGRVEDQMSWYSTPKDLVYSFKNGSFFLTGTLSPSGDNCQIILDENSSGESSNGLQLDLRNGQFIISNGSTFRTTSFRWGYLNSTNNVCLVTNATLTITGYMTLGAHKGSDTTHSKSNSVVIAKGGVFNCPTATQEFDVGWHSEDDLLFIDGGTMTDGRTTRIGYQDCLNTVFKVRGETASVSFSKALTFDNAATLACELPLPTDRAVMTSTSTVTINPGTKFAVTLPEGFTPGTYTILTANSITGTIADADISVMGKGTCKLVQDGTSIKMTVKPKIGLILIVR
nr:hypothetical protein [Kiritimatiellia bacterium]